MDLPLRWRRPRLIFVNSMSDLFHEDIPDDYIAAVFAVMREAKHHQFQVLTKRAPRMRDLANAIGVPPNVWMGVSVESAAYVPRIADLRQVQADIRFLSLEPLLGPLPKLDLRGIQWVIVGGESGPGARPMEKNWVRGIRTLCRKAQVAFFFKQWGGTQKSRNGRELDGRTWDEMPVKVPAAASAVERASARLQLIG
jgi:protein gp37